MARRESCLLILVKMLILISLLIAGVIAAFFYIRNQLNEYFNRGATIEVPDFRGKHLVQVFKEKPPDLLIEKADEKFDVRYPKDFVISQVPEPGTRVKPNKKILLTISLGSKQVNVPDLTQRSLRESRLTLINAQLLEGNVAYIRSSKIERDRVITQSPLPAMGQAVQGKVDLLVSLGRGQVRMPLPNLVGKNLIEAQTSLTAWGLKPGRVITRKDPSHPSQTVISTVPAPFESVTEGTTVDLLVSSGNEEGNAKPSELERFEFVMGTSGESAVGAAAATTKPRSETKPTVASPTSTPAAPRIFLSDESEPNKPQIVPPLPPVPSSQQTTQITFVMPDGFMPKEVKFFQVSREGRSQVYVGTHKPLDLIKVNVPKIPSSKIQIYINDVPIEERPVQ